MRDEDRETGPPRKNMPFISTPTPTVNLYQPTNVISEPSGVTAAAREDESLPFVIESNTCGFTFGGAVTCDVGYSCVNVNDYRGCCAAGATDCSSAIYTGCLNYEDMPNAAWCGPQTLCCLLTKAYCAIYGYSTDEQPGATFTYIECAETPAFGELYPYPPELSTTPQTSCTESVSSVLVVGAPIEGTPSSSSSSSAAASLHKGVIVGATLGSVAFGAFLILGIFLFSRRRRRRQEERRIQSTIKASISPPSTGITPVADKASIAHTRQLSTIHERKASSPSSVSPAKQQAPAPNARRPHSYGQNWPLGAEAAPISPRNPLSSHPVIFSQGQRPTRSQSERSHSSRYMRNVVPKLRMPTPRSGATALSPAPLGKPEGRHSLAGAIGIALQSPRTSYVPPPTIDTKFQEEVSRTRGSGDERTPKLPHQPSSATSALARIPASTSGGVVTNDKDTRDKRNIESGDDIVSPISPTDGNASPLDVSPLESRRGSFGQR
ncbi:hypothetical protein F5Y08DRAFT_350921 [Xylaria arbuscula]|nr:hypothetical protein F5Y08DRAFT_350921 [Xylaria arbuscula]